MLYAPQKCNLHGQWLLSPMRGSSNLSTAQLQCFVLEGAQSNRHTWQACNMYTLGGKALPSRSWSWLSCKQPTKFQQPELSNWTKRQGCPLEVAKHGMAKRSHRSSDCYTQQTCKDNDGPTLGTRNVGSHTSLACVVPVSNPKVGFATRHNGV